MSTMFGVLTMMVIIQGMSSLQILKTVIPSTAIKGEDLVLQCEYDLQGDTLYSVKSFHDGQEFYRHIPSDTPANVMFRHPGFQIKEQNSNETQLVLTIVDLTASGEYRCEISGEAPLFQTATSSNLLTVVVLPEAGPQITGSLPSYNIGDILLANCSSYNSLPAASLDWYVNGQVAREILKTKYQEVVSSAGLISSTIGLRLPVEKSQFLNSGTLNIKCTATINPVYWKSSEKSIHKVRKSYYFTLWNLGTTTSSSLLISSSMFTITSIFIALQCVV